VISELARNNPDLLVGAGTVLNLESAQRCLDAGAKFLTSPGLKLEIVEFAIKHNVVVIPGALTPTEIVAAWDAGADFVKVFPCAAVNGPSYIKSLKVPFPDIPLIASGGVNQKTAAEFIFAGATALGIGRDLIQPAAIERREREWIRELSHRFLEMVQEAQNRGKDE
jgi:2-dehydro-3-deoxyphosphogluconate aldolase/(4S)-4-hydroxy-2-oxoglutarate aldolase